MWQPKTLGEMRTIRGCRESELNQLSRWLVTAVLRLNYRRNYSAVAPNFLRDRDTRRNRLSSIMIPRTKPFATLQQNCANFAGWGRLRFSRCELFFHSRGRGGHCSLGPAASVQEGRRVAADGQVSRVT